VNRESLAQLCSKFHADYERAYGRGYPADGVELVKYRVTAIGAIPSPPVRKAPHKDAPCRNRRKRVRAVFFHESGGFTENGVYDRYKLEPGPHIIRPAVVEEMDLNTLIHPGFRADVDTFGNLLIAPTQP
jgi:N-methylhydantoinase A